MVAPAEWHPLEGAARWAEVEFPLPAAYFEAGALPSSLELAYEVGGGGGHALYVRSGAKIALEKDGVTDRTITLDEGVYGSQEDHEKHTWTRVDLPAGYTSGSISLSWKDQGFGKERGGCGAGRTAKAPPPPPPAPAT